MKTTVKACTGNGTFDNAHGTLYKFEYEMTDGIVISANHKKEGGNFPVGAEVEYEIKGSNKYGSYGSVKKPDSEEYANRSAGSSSAPSAGGASTDVKIARQSSLKLALEYFHLSGWPEGQEGSLKLLCNTAEYLTNYVLSDHKAPSVSVPQKQENVAPAAPIAPHSVSPEEDLASQMETGHLGDPDDLPF